MIKPTTGANIYRTYRSSFIKKKPVQVDRGAAHSDLSDHCLLYAVNSVDQTLGQAGLCGRNNTLV